MQLWCAEVRGNRRRRRRRKRKIGRKRKRDGDLLGVGDVSLVKSAAAEVSDGVVRVNHAAT